MQALYYQDFYSNHIPDIIKEMFIEKLYDPYFKGKKDLNIIDIGSNVGIFTLYAYPYAAKIIAVEPAKIHYGCLKRMLEQNNMVDKVIVQTTAISNYVGKTTFYHSSNTTAFSLSKVINDNGESEEVTVTTIDTLYNSIDHCDVLKVDVEGEEMKIFCSEEFKKVVPKTDIVLVEYHDWSGATPSQLKWCLQDLGFRVDQLKTAATVFAATRI